MNRDFDEVDIDLLADYVGGALAGTPEDATVAGLIARDESWRTAYEALARGMAAVGTELSALGAEPEPMPADVAERLDRAFQSTTGPRLVAVGGDERAARAVPARTRARRARRWAVPIAVAAVVLAFAGFGINYVLDLGRSTTTSAATSSGAAAPEAARKDANAPEAATAQAPGAKPAPLAALPPADRIVSSGTDYRHATLTAGLPATAFQAPNTATDTSGATGPLARLRPAAALLTCLNAIAEENGAGPISVQSVDYARYVEAPAVVVRFTAGNGSWVWASGADCGAPGVGASRLDTAKVG